MEYFIVKIRDFLPKNSSFLSIFSKSSSLDWSDCTQNSFQPLWFDTSTLLVVPRSSFGLNSGYRFAGILLDDRLLFFSFSWLFLSFGNSESFFLFFFSLSSPIFLWLELLIVLFISFDHRIISKRIKPRKIQWKLSINKS